jgi:hypothetical protein
VNFNVRRSARKGIERSGFPAPARRRKSLTGSPLVTILRAAVRMAHRRKLRFYSGKIPNLHSHPIGARMPIQFWRFIDKVTYHAGHLDRHQWIALSVLVLVLGFVCMRGFGSRNNY